MKCFAPSLALALTTLLVTADALSIHSSDITASSTGGHETLEKTWTVSSAKHLRDLFVLIPGNVFIDYDASLKSVEGVVAKIVVSGDSEDLLNVFDVVPRDSEDDDKASSEDCFMVHLKNKDALVKGYAITQIYVADKNVLTSLTVVSAHDAVLGESVLVANDATASVKLSTVGDGTLFFTSKDKFIAESLKIVMGGSGTVQFQVASLQTTKDVKLSMGGSGQIALLAHEIQTAKFETDVGGSGEVFVQSDSLTAHDLSTSIGGSGNVMLSKSGTCTNQKISIAGSGTVSTGSIACSDTKVSLTGSGHAVVQTTNSLKISTINSGSVQYVNARPKKVSQSSFSHHDILSQASENAYTTYKTVEIPARAPLLLDLKIQQSRFSDKPNVEVVSGEKNSPFATNFAAAFTPSSAAGGLWSVAPVVGIAGVALTAVGSLVRKFRQQQNREEYAPLV